MLMLRLLSQVIKHILIHFPASAQPLLKRLGCFLAFQDKLVTSDVIVVLGGGTIQRIHYGAELYLKGFGSKLIVCKNIALNKFAHTKSKSTVEEAIRLGVKPGDIIHEKSPRTTAEEAKNLVPVFAKFGFRSAVIVSDGYHLRRARQLFQMAFFGTGVRLNLRSSGTLSFDPNKWWHKEEDVKNLLDEYISLLFLRSLQPT